MFSQRHTICNRRGSERSDWVCELRVGSFQPASTSMRLMDDAQFDQGYLLVFIRAFPSIPSVIQSLLPFQLHRPHRQVPMRIQNLKSALLLALVAVLIRK
jgi:hypothetical protein